MWRWWARSEAGCLCARARSRLMVLMCVAEAPLLLPCCGVQFEWRSASSPAPSQLSYREGSGGFGRVGDSSSACSTLPSMQIKTARTMRAFIMRTPWCAYLSAKVCTLLEPNTKIHQHFLFLFFFWILLEHHLLIQWFVFSTQIILVIIMSSDIRFTP